MVHDFESVKRRDEFNDLVDKLIARKFPFVLSPEQWRSVQTTPLEWKEVKFKHENQNLVPTSRGVYAFIVRHDNNFFPNQHGYIFYIGETGNKSADRNLRIRFGEYLKEADFFKKRPKVYTMLSNFRDDLFFAYSEIPDMQVNLIDIEDRLCDALIPWAVSDDFSANVRPVVKAVWR